MKITEKLLVLSLALAIPLISGSVIAGEDNGKVRRLTAPGKKPALVLPNDTASIDFDFGEFKASLNALGEMKIKGWLKHSRIRCADYSVGLRFGEGERGCTNVKWLGEARYLSFRKHCNSAALEHNGYEKDQIVAGYFNKVSCAQRLIRCSGVCD